MSAATRSERADAFAALISAPEPSPARATQAPELCGAGDRFHDYVLDEYEPASPAVGKQRSVNLLYESFAIAGLEREGRAVVDAVRTGLGPFRTVWGIKRIDGSDELSWELYFYDFQRAHADLTVARISELLAPHVKVGAREPRPLPWHMFSVEFGRAQLRDRAPAALDLYIDMRSYKCVGESLQFENVYTFHEAKKAIDEVLHRIRSCVHFDPKRDQLQKLMPPHLFHCFKICVANKRAADALYFSRIRTSAFVRFLHDHGWPRELRDYVLTREPALNHLLWDVGIDFRAVDGRATPTKTGIYGSF